MKELEKLSWTENQIIKTMKFVIVTHVNSVSLGSHNMTSHSLGPRQSSVWRSLLVKTSLDPFKLLYLTSLKFYISGKLLGGRP